MENNNQVVNEIKQKKSLKRIIIKYSITIAICLTLTIISLFLRNFLNAVVGTKEYYRIWADSFTIPGLAFIFLALIIFLVNEESLTALGYLGRTIVRALTPSKKESMNYYEYSQSKKKITGYSCILWVGLAFFLVGLVFLILFYTA